jgi:hypothetical protein
MYHSTMQRFAVAAARDVLLAQGAPARGAALHQIVVASVLALALSALLGWVAVAAHAGRFPVLKRVARFAERVGGLPAWSAVPLVIGAVSLIVAAFGFYWDVSWHIDRGRDPGPFSNPAHWFIIWGLVGIVVAGLASVALVTEDDAPRTAIRLRNGWSAPLGGALVLLCGVIALAGFPLDDIWHALFGQDVTLWGPTHIQMIGGASLATLGLWILAEEGRRHRRRHRLPWISEHRDVLAGGAFLLGLSTLQGEFDFGVPQFRQLYHPVLLMLAAGIGLVAVRIRAGRGGALGATAFFLAVRGLLTLLVGPVLGRSTLHFPLYLAEAILVEGVATVVSTDRQVSFGTACGVAIGTAGLAAEWGWSHLWMPLPWHASLFSLGAVFGFLAAVAGSVLGALVGRALLEPGAPRQRVPRGAGVLAGAVALFCIAFPLPMSAHSEWRAEVTLTTVRRAPTRWVTATMRLVPAAAHRAARDADWFDVTDWQGAQGTDGGLVVTPLDPVGGGVYRTRSAFPVYGDWKALLRLHAGSSVQAVPIYLPLDRAIPAAEVPAFHRFTRPFEQDKGILQREAVGGPHGLELAAYILLLILALLWIASMAWGLRRLEADAERAPAQVIRRTPLRAAS